jgi:hypothetical protein
MLTPPTTPPSGPQTQYRLTTMETEDSVPDTDIIMNEDENKGAGDPGSNFDTVPKLSDGSSAGDAPQETGTTYTLDHCSETVMTMKKP